MLQVVSGGASLVGRLLPEQARQAGLAARDLEEAATRLAALASETMTCWQPRSQARRMSTAATAFGRPRLS